MTTEVLGNLSFLNTPTVNGLDVLLNAGGTPLILSDVTGNLPAPGTAGRLFIDTTANTILRDNGASWVPLGSSTVYTGVGSQIDVTGSLIGIAANPILPGVEGVRLPSGTTAQRALAPAPGDIRFNTTTGKTETFNGTFWAPEGTILQVVSGLIAATTTTSQIPFDNTSPLVTEGSQIWTTTFMPISASSRLLIHYNLTVAQSTVARTITTAVFAGSTVIAAASQIVPSGATTQNLPHSLSIHDGYEPGSTAPITFSARIGANGTGTTYVNSTSTATLGGALVSYFTITEIS